MASLATHELPLGSVYAKHLLRRATFVYTKKLVNQFALLTPTQALDLLLQETPLPLNLPYDPLPTGTPDGFWTESAASPGSFAGQSRKAGIVAGWWWYNAINTATLKFKMSHFLSTRFTVEKSNSAGTATDFFDYIRLVQYYALGNYKTLAKKITLNNSMLQYLNNTANTKTAPNENYAREFLELFTIGKGETTLPGNYTNYTEADIVLAAKILTGVKRQINRSVIDAETRIPCGYYDIAKHDTTTKVFSGAFSNTAITGGTTAATIDVELDNFIAMIFGKIATAKHICRKIYLYFVKGTITSDVETDIIEPLAQQLFSNGYEMAPIIRKLLESKHFYDLDDSNSNDETIGGIVKSPIQLISEVCTYLKATIPDPNTNPLAFYNTFWWNFVHNSFLAGSNMILFDPDNVAGHPAYHQAPDYDKNWIASSTLIARYRAGESMLDGFNRIAGNNSIAAKINISSVIKNDGLISNASDAYILTSELCQALFAQAPDASRINYFMNSFLLQGREAYYWADAWQSYLSTNNNSVVESRLKLMVTKILSAPESQIF